MGEQALEHANIALKVQNMFCVEERGEVKAYVCKKCEKGFPFLGTQQGNTFPIRDSRQATMALTQCKAHLEGHLDLDLKCFYCPNTFNKSSLLRKHKKRMHVGLLVEELVIKGERKNNIKKFKESLRQSKPTKGKDEHEHEIKTRPDESVIEKNMTRSREISEKVDEQLIVDGNVLKCKVCDKEVIKTKEQRNCMQTFRSHIETHINTAVECDYCSSVLQGLNLLKAKKRKNHKSQYEDEKELKAKIASQCLSKAVSNSVQSIEMPLPPKKVDVQAIVKEERIKRKEIQEKIKEHCITKGLGKEQTFTCAICSRS